MTTYRLPDWLNGHKCREIGEDRSGVLVEIDQHEGTRIIVPRALLTAVKPPLPDAYAKVTSKTNTVEIFHRIADGTWWSVSEYQEEPLSLEELREHGEVTFLVPDPADEAPALPWRESHELTDDVHVANGVIWIEIQAGWHDADEARLRAAVILRAAREVEQP